MSFGNSYRNSDIGLTVLRKASEAAESVVDVVIVTTPGFPRAKEWALCTLHEKTNSISDVNIYAYEAWSSFDEEFTWETPLNHGKLLVNLLATRQNSGAENTSLRPIVLMAHSLAGFIVKQCLVLLYTQKSRYRLLRNMIASVVLLGCPHSSLPETRSSFIKKTLKILEIAAERRGQRIKNIARLESRQDLVDLCTQYDSMGGNVNILTLYETMSTKVSRGLRPSSMVRLVDANLARVDRNRFEKLVEVQSDHRSLPLLNDEPSSQGWSELVIGYIQVLIQQAQEIRRLSPSQDMEAGIESSGLEPSTPDHQTPKPHLKESAFLVDMSISRQRNTDFQGRETVLSNLKQHLLDGPRVAVLYGKGGLGKSETAIEFAYRHQKDFDAVLWMQADDLSKLRQDFGTFAARLGLQPEDVAKDPFTSRDIVKDWLIDPLKSNGSGSQKAKWLVIFDGVDTMETLKEFEILYGKGSILITSRHPDLFSAFNQDQLSLPKDQRVEIRVENLDLFSETEGTAALKKFAELDMNEDVDEQAAREIVGLVDGWPLAIRQMAGIIRNNDLTLPEFYERFKSERRDVSAQQISERDTMLSSIRMAKLSLNAMALLRVCAMLDPDCIQESLFVMETAVETILEDFPLATKRFEDARDELLSASLVQRNAEKKELWMHRVVQDAVRDSCTSSIFDLAFRAAAALVKKAWKPVPPGVRDNVKLWEPCAAFLRHVLHLQQVFVRTNPVEIPCKAWPAIQPCFSFAWLLHEVGCLQRGLGDTSGIENTLVLALSVCEQIPRNEPFDLLCDIYHGLGAWANETNHPQACLKYNTLYLRICEDAKNERTAAAYNQYGTGLTMERRYPEAILAYEKSIALYAKLALEKPCPDSLPVVNLGVVKWLIGDYESAWTILTAGQQAREEAFGFMDPDSFRTGRFFHALGNVCYDQGNMSKSEFWHTQALDQYKQSLGPRHHRTADVCHRVADHYLRKGEIDKASSLIDQALGSWRMDQTSFKPEIARTTWLKARELSLRGNLTGALDLQRTAALMRGELKPGDQRQSKHLSDADFDDLVAFWSR
ncbi:hypothetical protein M409DRAFT_28977 [Zasmidium cellare ATCC 36951]|uniref:Uncharacterized protein n=1 Tax=Zasmidium cellare ATCC 36951 TaxID=1080233 RepID=A0A6A6C0Q3_ZASCE|nr:uncharacterized protein M409DRAFT_28977 [Zasmidium cellare ATCC 36951]KAF2160591.1 hypothetical protein M409DRAFT_28977 [Zasmidium cellare ATCC 36951]